MNKLNRPTALSLGAIALIFGAIGPWIAVLGLINGGPSNDTETAIVVFGGIVLVIGSALTGIAMRGVSILIGVAILLESLNTLRQVIHAHDSAVVSPGWGLYLSIVAGLFLIASTWVAKGKSL